jgi:hypothetical protein
VKLTHSEHATRAMLMGRTYDWTDGTYCRTEPDGSLDTNDMLCCITLEKIHISDAGGRRVTLSGATHWTRPPNRETDWARMDDEE